MYKKFNELYWKAATAFHHITSFGNFPEPKPPYEITTLKTLEKNLINAISEKPGKDFSKYLISLPLSKAIKKRQSCRNFGLEPLLKDQILYILWSAYGLKENSSFRNVPSAGALYPLTFYIYSKSVQNLKEAFYTFYPNEVGLVQNPFSIPANIDVWFKTTLVDYAKLSTLIIITGNWNNVCAKYGCRGYRYVLIEAGHAAQNMCLAATSMSIPHLTIGGFEDDLINNHLKLNTTNEAVVYILALGNT